MINFLLIAACLLTGNHYSWGGFDSRWADANNWGSMDFPQAGDDITVGCKWGGEWTPVTTIDLMGERSVERIDVWPDYETTLTGGSIAAGEVCGNGTLIVQCDLTAGSINVDTLRIGNAVSEVPEPSEFLMLAIAMIFILGKHKWRQ